MLYYYTIYKITNKVNNKYYIGKHQTKNLNDNYFGSGKLLKRAIEKHGKENFVKEILHVFDNEVEMNSKEKELVVVSEETYNLNEGGQGGFGYINKNNLGVQKIARQKANESILKKYGVNNPAKLDFVRKKFSDNMKFQYKSGKRSRVSGMKDKKHTQKTIELFKNIRKGKGLGEQNPMYGRKWMNNGIDSIPVVHPQIQQYLNDGFIFGKLR